MPRHLLATLAVAALAATACAGSVDGTDDGAIRDAVVEPGVTALDDAGSLACDADARVLRTALETYAIMNGEPAVDESALVDAGSLREESELWDVAAGELVAQDARCA